MKVKVKYTRGGKSKQMHERYANLLARMGLVTIEHEPGMRTNSWERNQGKEPVDDQPEISPRTGKPKRQYKRRDLKAEE